MKLIVSWVFLFLFIGISANALTVFPTNLDRADRKVFLEVLGYGTAPKLLSNPYPLGGYQGWEIGLSNEFLSLEEVAGLGTPPAGQVVSKGEFNFYNLSFAKGLYKNIDTTLSFLPTLQGEGVSGFAAQVKWTFYESPNMPLTLATNLYGGSINIQSLLGVDSLGLDLICAMSMDDLAIYFGGGQTRVIGTFTGGANGITDDQDRHSLSLESMHTLFGLSFNVSKLLIAFQVDRYHEPVYGAKIGFRY